MHIPDATPSTLTLDPLLRSKYSFRHLTASVTCYETNEPLVDQESIEKEGITTEPFWETANDVEGECYLPYIASHPTFTLSVRASVFERVVCAQALLPGNWEVVLKAGYRPYSVQVAVLESFIDLSKVRHPDWPDDKHLAQAQLFVADPRIVCPPHTTGGAVDIDVRDRISGEYIDMGCPPNTDSEISFLHSDLLTAEQYSNRMLLLEAMLAAGFAPNPNEWWHYQYGETYWAAFYGYETTQYDIIKV